MIEEQWPDGWKSPTLEKLIRENRELRETIAGQDIVIRSLTQASNFYRDLWLEAIAK